MKKIIHAVLFLLGATALYAEISVPFFGGNNFDFEAYTTFAADTNDGSTGLETTVGVGLWFEMTPYGDYNLTPQRDALSVSLKLANSAIYAWRGYDMYGSNPPGDNYNRDSMYDGYIPKPNDVTGDQANSLWFNTFIAQLEYNQYWVRIAGIEPEVTLSQASIRSVFDPLINNRTAVDKNTMYLPLFHSGGHYRPWPNPGIVSVIAQDLVHLNRRDVQIAGNLSAGMNSELLDLTVKTGAWKIGEENVDNSWIGGFDVAFRPDMVQNIKFSFLAAVNYGTITVTDTITNPNKEDPAADPTILSENPLAFGLGYEYRFDLPRRMILRPYAGVDFVYETNSEEYQWEAGGGLQLFFRGTSARFKRNTKIGGDTLGDVELPAALIAGANIGNVGDGYIVNAIISFNEDPNSSLIPKLGGFANIEMMNIGAQEYKVDVYSAGGTATTPETVTYKDFLWAGMIQLEYLAHEKLMPYIFMRYMPAIMPAGFDLKLTDPIYGKDFTSVTSKIGIFFKPINHLSVDVWYERTDFAVKDEWTLDNGLISVTVRVAL